MIPEFGNKKRRLSKNPRKPSVFQRIATYFEMLLRPLAGASQSRKGTQYDRDGKS